MSNQEYINTKDLGIPPTHAPRANINFNYVWDQIAQQWIPLLKEGGEQGTLDSILNNTKAHVHKFGSHPSVPQDADFNNQYTIWDGETNYQYPNDSGETIQIVSDNTTDNQIVFIQGLDENFNLKSEEINLNGTTPVNLTGLWSRVFRAYNNDSSDFQGNICVIKSGTWTGSSSPNIYAKILVGNNQSLMSVYTIHSEYTGYLLKFSITAQNTGSSSAIAYTLHMVTRESGKVFRVLARTSA